MKFNLKLIGSFLLLTSAVAQASIVLVTGTPSDSYNSPAITKPSPNLGGDLINFDNLTPFATLSTYSSQGVSILSPDGFVVDPFSTQTGPNELFDSTLDGSADIFINLSARSSYVGVGVADSDITVGGDPVTILLQALGAGGVNLGSAFAVTIQETGSNPGNAYFVLRDTSNDIFGLQITQPVGNANYSGLAIDDVQAAPEPSSFVLLIGGAFIFGLFRLRKSA
jgi:hypothetical protein